MFSFKHAGRHRRLVLGMTIGLGVPLASGCGAKATGTDDVGWQQDLPARDTGWDEFREARTVTEDGTSQYLIANDLVSPDLADLRAYYDNYHASTVPKSTGVKDTTGAWVKWANPALNYCVASSTHWGSSTKRNYIRALMVEAARRWHLEANITWTETSVTGTTCETSQPKSGGAIQFAVIKDAVNTNGGHSFLPNWTVANRKFFVGTNIFNLSGYSAFASAGTLTDLLDVPFFMHELGHTAGLEHELGHSGSGATCSTDLEANRSAGFTSGDLTPVFDLCSVMDNCILSGSQRQTTCAGIATRFITSQDGFGMRALYGGPNIWPTVVSAHLL